MSDFDSYANRYENVSMHRSDDGVIEVTLHTGGGSLKWTTVAHRELGFAFADIGADRDNRVMILTGAGDNFLAEVDYAGGSFDIQPDLLWDMLYWEGKRLLENLLNIEVPIIAAVNGPVREHSELAVLSDIVLASEHALFQDDCHFIGGAVPGDGISVVWQQLLGPNRGRYFLLTGQEISAQEALELGVVAEVLPRHLLLDRARELAHSMAQKPTLTLRYTRVVFTQHIKRRLLDELGYGLILESRADTARRTAPDL